MLTICGYIVSYMLGAISFGVIVLVVMVKLHERPATPPTMYRRQWRDRRNAPGTEYVEVPPTVKWEARATEDGRGVRYEFMGVANEEV